MGMRRTARRGNGYLFRTNQTAAVFPGTVADHKSFVAAPITLFAIGAMDDRAEHGRSEVRAL